MAQPNDGRVSGTIPGGSKRISAIRLQARCRRANRAGSAATLLPAQTTTTTRRNRRIPPRRKTPTRPVRRATSPANSSVQGTTIPIRIWIIRETHSIATAAVPIIGKGAPALITAPLGKLALCRISASVITTSMIWMPD